VSPIWEQRLPFRRCVLVFARWSKRLRDDMSVTTKSCYYKGFPDLDQEKWTCADLVIVPMSFLDAPAEQGLQAGEVGTIREAAPAPVRNRSEAMAS
jgi:hypothetical protein